MSAQYNLSHQEYRIMKLLWAEQGKLSLKEVAGLLHFAGFTITTGTVKTYLQRLIKKGAMDAVKNGRNLRYYPAMNELSYAQKWTRELIRTAFDNSLVNFLTAYTAGGPLSEGDKEALQKSFLIPGK